MAKASSVITELSGAVTTRRRIHYKRMETKYAPRSMNCLQEKRSPKRRQKPLDAASNVRDVAMKMYIRYLVFLVLITGCSGRLPLGEINDEEIAGLSSHKETVILNF